MEPATVLIVGAGSSGLVLAISLLQNGVPVRLIEKSWTPRLGQRGAGIMPRSLELFSLLGMADEVVRRAIHVPFVRKYQLPGGIKILQEFAMAPLTEPTPTHPFLNPMLLGQDALETIFHDALAKLGCKVEKGTELLSFQQDENCVEVNLVKRGANVEESEQETCKYEWMVGTDGAKGAVRKLLGLKFLGETRTVENFVVGDICVEGLSSKYWHMWGDASEVFHDSVRDCFMKNTGNRKDIKFGIIPWMSYYTPNIRMVDSFSKGRVFIAGDAGHVHSPTGGQGVNTGIQDSFNLGWKLALMAKGLANPSLLKSYSNERLPVIAEMLDQTTKLLDRTFKGEDEEGGWKSDGSLFQLGVNYRWSPIVLDERKSIEASQEAEEDAMMEDFNFYDNDEKIDSYGADFDGRLRGGDRAPDSSGLISATHHTALLFADFVDCNQVLQEIRRYPKDLIKSVVIVRPKRPAPLGSNLADLVLEDHDGHAYEAYTSKVCGLVLVRPDGIVGAILRGPSSLRRYFQVLLTSP